MLQGKEMNNFWTRHIFHNFMIPGNMYSNIIFAKIGEILPYLDNPVLRGFLPYKYMQKLYLVYWGEKLWETNEV